MKSRPPFWHEIGLHYDRHGIHCPFHGMSDAAFFGRWSDGQARLGRSIIAESAAR